MVGGVNLTELARLRGSHLQAAYQWFRETTLAVFAVRVNSRKVARCAVREVGPAGPWTVP